MEPQKKSSPLDVFINISSIVLVYWISISFISLLFYLINIMLPDNVAGYFNYSATTIKWNLSLLVVLFPLYIYLVRFTIKDIDKNPEKSELRVKKWLSYLTIFIALAAMIGVIISLIYNFLNGELTSRFALKALVVFAVSAFVLWWLRFDLNRRPGEFPSFARNVAYSGIALISLGIIIGFFVAGSPISARKLAFDQTRVYDLQNIQSRIIYYWQNKNTLPKSLTDLNNNLENYVIPIDPETGNLYDYRIIDALNFELCADFNLASNKSSIENIPQPKLDNRPMTVDSWSHSEGHFCFDREIDKDFYQIKK